MFYRDQRVKYNDREFIFISGNQDTNVCFLRDKTNKTQEYAVPLDQVKKIHTHNKQDDMLRRARRRRGLSVMPSSWQHRPLVMSEPVQIAEPTPSAPEITSE